MSHDVVADALNKMMNAHKAGKESVVVRVHSKLLLSILALGKLRGYVSDYKVDGREMKIEIGSKFNACKSVKPRYLVKSKDIMKYVRRYLPARDMGVLIISTSQGLMTHHSAIEKNIGGSIVAYFY